MNNYILFCFFLTSTSVQLQTIGILYHREESVFRIPFFFAPSHIADCAITLWQK